MRANQQASTRSSMSKMSKAFLLTDTRVLVSLTLRYITMDRVDTLDLAISYQSVLLF
jgi:hypothetical protein